MTEKEARSSICCCPNGSQLIDREGCKNELERYSCADRCSRWLRVFSFFILNAIYVTFGAATFSALEIDSEQANCDTAKADYINFISGLETDNSGNIKLSPEQLNTLIENVKTYTNDGLDVSGSGIVSCSDSWSFMNALYFCFTIGTTIGYGDISPKTPYGKLVFIFYVIPGICLCGAFIAELSKLMFARLKRGKARFARCFNTQHVWIYWTINSLLLFCICWLVPASIVYAITDFSFFDSCYFSMVTFTTVGFGDYTITGYNLKFVIVCFSYFGLAWIGIVTSLVMDKIQSANRLATTKEEKLEPTSDPVVIIENYTQC